MPPSPPKAVPPQMYCGLDHHLLREPSCAIMDPNLLRCGQRIKSGLRLGTAVCQSCYQNLEKIYEIKKKNAVQFRKRRLDERKIDFQSESPER